MWVQSLGREDPWSREWQPTPVFMPGNPIDGGVWWATVRGVAKESDTNERLSTHTHTHTHTQIYIWQ